MRTQFLVALGSTTTLLAAGGFATYGFVTINGQQRVSEIAKKHGLPVKSSDLVPVKHPPESQNAYELYSQLDVAIGSIPNQTRFGTSNFTPGFTTESLKQFLSVRSQALMTARRMARRPYWDAHRKWDDPNISYLPELARLREGMDLLLLSAQVRQASGDVEGSLEDLERAAVFTRYPISEPTMQGLCTYVDFCHGLNMHMFTLAPKIVAQPALVPRFMALFDAMKDPDIDPAVRGDGYMLSNYALNEVKDSGDDFNPGLRVQERIRSATRGMWGPQLIEKYGALYDGVRTKLSQDDLSGAEVLTKDYDDWLSKQPYWGQFPRSHFVWPAFVRELRDFRMRRTLVRVGVDALINHRLPEVKGVRDDYSGQDVRLNITKDGWTLYSVGHDGIDGGGKIPSRPWDPSHDIIASYDGSRARIFGI